MFTSPLIVFAMKEESRGHFDDHRIVHTGVGKVNAAFGLMQALRDGKRPSVVVNMGTAGSRLHAGGTIVNPTRFIQRDMDVTALGFEMYKTPFSDDPVQINGGVALDNMIDGLCGSGDNFDISEKAGQFDVVDMEAYALALICQREEIPFLCLKYVSDGADDGANQDWNAALEKTAVALRSVLDTLV